MELFQGLDMQSTAANLQIQMPQLTINQVVQRKVATARKLTTALARQADVNAIKRLNDFIASVERLVPGEIRSQEDWNSFISQYCCRGWERNLHVDEVLTNFGFERGLGVRLKEDKDKALKGALRWLSKAFECYGIQGSMCDVVNLIYAMTGEPPGSQPYEKTVADVQQFGGMLRTRQLDSIWLPSHLVMDCEVDDTLVWLLLTHLHSLRGTALYTVAQLPEAPEFQDLGGRLRNLRVEVITDPESANSEAVKLYWQIPSRSGTM